MISKHSFVFLSANLLLFLQPKILQTPIVCLFYLCLVYSYKILCEISDYAFPPAFSGISDQCITLCLHYIMFILLYSISPCYTVRRKKYCCCDCNSCHFFLQSSSPFLHRIKCSIRHLHIHQHTSTCTHPPAHIHQHTSTCTHPPAHILQHTSTSAHPPAHIHQHTSTNIHTSQQRFSA